MAHFAELNSSNEVLQVVVISNTEVDANGGDESSEAETFVASLVPYRTGGASWKQTSFNGNFRKQYAGIGHLYNPSLDKFTNPKPYTSWTLDSSGTWNAPVTYPNDVEENSLIVFPSWDEGNRRWLGSTWSSNIEKFQTEKQYTWDASGLAWTEV